MKKGVTTKAPRICRRCGVVFDGGPRAWYCPKCREMRKKLQKDRYNERRKRGLSLSLGESVGRCEVCGREFIYASARQRYCPDCAKEAIKTSDRRQGREYYHAKNTEEYRAKRAGRRKERHVRKSPTVCPVCGKPVGKPPTRQCYCSVECHRIMNAYNTAKFYFKKGLRRPLPPLEEWVAQKQMERTCEVCGKELPSTRKRYCSEECMRIGMSYTTALSHYLAGRRSEPPTWEEWIEQHKK